MVIIYKKAISKKPYIKGRGLINSLIDKLPIELHLPGYQFCGPGTKLEKRLARGDRGINKLDAACREHDIAYSKNSDTQSRNKADLILAERAWERVKSKDSSLPERANAWLVTNAMKTKTKFGMGIKIEKKKNTCTNSNGIKNFTAAVRSAKKLIKKHKSKDARSAIKIAKRAIQKSLYNRFDNSKNVQVPRVIPIPKTGGLLPLVPLFAALSAIGGLASGSATIAKAINEAKAAREQLKEAKRHNQRMESVAIGKGLYLKPYKKGYGLYVGSKNF